MPRRQGYALLIALVAGTAALAAAVAFAGSLLFSGSGARPQQITAPDPRSVARTPAAPPTPPASGPPPGRPHPSTG